MTWFDGLLALILGLSTLHGFRRGLVLEVFALAALVVGVAAGFVYHGTVAEYLEPWIEHRTATRILGFVLVSAAVGFGVHMLGRWVRTMVHAVFLGWADTLVGAGIGLLRGWLLCWAVLTLGLAYLPAAESASKDSRVAPIVLSATERVNALLPDDLRERIDVRLEDLRKAWRNLKEE